MKCCWTASLHPAYPYYFEIGMAKFTTSLPVISFCFRYWDTLFGFSQDFVWDFVRQLLFLSNTNTILANMGLKSYQPFLELPDRPWHQ